MRVLMISKALLVGSYHDKIEELVRLGCDMHVVIPSHWRDQTPEVSHATTYTIHVLRAALQGKNHFHFFPRIESAIEAVQPNVIHIDEESYSYVTFHAMRIASKRRIPSLFFNWQNIHKRYPFPFSSFETYNMRNAASAIAGNQDAKVILEQKGCSVPIYVIPQFGVNARVFVRGDSANMKAQLFGDANVRVVGFGGRLVEEKGLSTLLHAFATLPSETRLLLVGGGPYASEIRAIANDLAIGERMRVLDHVASTEMPRYLNCMDCLVLPSETRANWKEQFGRILIEAMACEVPVIGSSSGEIPRVIGDAGVVFREGSIADLTRSLEQVLFDSVQHAQFAKAGRARVLELFTNESVARATFAVYSSMLAS